MDRWTGVKISLYTSWVKPMPVRLHAGLLRGAALLVSGVLLAEQIPVRHIEGTVHGFLVLRNQEGAALASGDLIQTVQGDRLVSSLIFHFKDGSLDDETTTFSQ